MLDAVIELRREAQALDLQGAARDGLGHVADPLEIVGDVDRGDDGAQVRRHRLAACDHRNGDLVDLALHLIDDLVGFNGLLGEAMVELQQSARGVGHRSFDHAAHLEDQLGEIGEFVLVGGDDVLVGKGHLVLAQPIRPVM